MIKFLRIKFHKKFTKNPSKKFLKVSLGEILEAFLIEYLQEYP